ncbi:hypothetical protein MED222_05660 [Vibrio sp. MED222]|nr:hypothetical protein MED222_05660 [Vibrio sp. MED222]
MVSNMNCSGSMYPLNIGGSVVYPPIQRSGPVSGYSIRDPILIEKCIWAFTPMPKSSEGSAI